MERNKKGLVKYLLCKFSLLLACFAITACEEVIDIDLKDGGEVLVIEGNVSNTETTHFVKISKTVPFSSPNTDNPQSNAKVTILEERSSDSNFNGYPITPKAERDFTEVSPGTYRILNYRASPGMKYTLTVALENEIYVASSTMPQPVLIDSIGTVTDNFFGEEEKTVGIVYQDPPGIKNYFRYLVMVNGEPTNLVFAFNDKFNDGKKVQRNFYHDDLNLAREDAVMVEQQCIDANVYSYFNGILANNPGAAAPGNPKSNFSNDALGYFSAHTVARAATSIE